MNDNVYGFSGDKNRCKLCKISLGVKLYDDEVLKRLKDYLKKIKTNQNQMMANGGRAGFMAGGMGRRAFLKMMELVELVAALKTGLINVFKPRSQAVEEVVETVTKTDAMGVPEHFAPLVNKIMKEGKLTKSQIEFKHTTPNKKRFRIRLRIRYG